MASGEHKTDQEVWDKYLRHTTPQALVSKHDGSIDKAVDAFLEVNNFGEEMAAWLGPAIFRYIEDTLDDDSDDDDDDYDDYDYG